MDGPMPDASMIRTRLENLVDQPRPVSSPPPDAAPVESPEGEPPVAEPPTEAPPAVPDDWGGEPVRVGPVEVTPQELDELLAIRSLHEFVDRSYRKILARPPDLKAIGHVWSLRLRPFYSRRKFLGKLLRTDEHRHLQIRPLYDQAHALERERHLLAQHRQAYEQERLALARHHADLERERRDLERERRELELRDEQRGQFAEQLRGIVELLRAAPGQHSRLLEQHRQLIEQQGAAAEPEDRLLDLLGQWPQQHGHFLEQQARLLHEQAQEHDRWIARADDLHREFLDELRRAGVAGEAGPGPGVAEEADSFVTDAYRLILKRSPEAAELARDSDRLRGEIGRIKGEFLRGLLEGHPAELDEGTSPDPAGQAARPRVADEPARCRVCGGDLAYKWSLKVLGGRHMAHYHECKGCEALQVVDPYWLAEAYADEGRPLAENPDPGRFSRNFSAYNYFAALHQAGLVPEAPVVLDYGGGYGLLAQMLKSAGYEAWQVDPYVPVPFLAADRHLRDLADFPDGSFDLVFALEVLEHLTDPVADLERLSRRLRPGGTLMLSTTIYRPEVHDRHWHYLAAAWGQHVTFWSRPALLRAAERAGFRSVGYFPGTDGFFILFSGLAAGDLKAKLAEASAALQDPDHLRRITGPWDLQAQGYVPVGAEPVVEAVAENARSPLAGRGAA
jgi:SAM-dependent methyltransferase